MLPSSEVCWTFGIQSLVGLAVSSPHVDRRGMLDLHTSAPSILECPMSAALPDGRIQREWLVYQGEILFAMAAVGGVRALARQAIDPLGRRRP